MKAMFGSHNTRVIIILALSVLLAIWIASASKSIENMEIAKMRIQLNNDSNIGRATKCDPKDPTTVSITWKPKDLSPSEQVDISVFYIAPHNMSAGFVNVSLYFHGEPDPFIGYSNYFSCADIDPHAHYICPFLQRRKIFISKNFPNLHPLTSFPGHYDIIVDVRNEKNEDMLCLNFTVYIEEL